MGCGWREVSGEVESAGFNYIYARCSLLYINVLGRSRAAYPSCRSRAI